MHLRWDLIVQALKGAFLIIECEILLKALADLVRMHLILARQSADCFDPGDCFQGCQKLELRKVLSLFIGHHYGPRHSWCKD